MGHRRKKRGRWRQLRCQRRRSETKRKHRLRGGAPRGPRTAESQRRRERGFNPNFRPSDGRRGTATIRFPSIADFGTHRDATVYALRDFRRACLESEFYSVFLDLSALEVISESAAVVLVAEIERSILLSGRREIGGNLPPIETEAYTVLQCLGAFRFLGIQAAPKPLLPAERGWYHIFSDREANGDLLGKLQDYFQPYINRFLGAEPRWDRQFYKAMLDAASNTLEHAYHKPGKNPWILGRWWAAGFVDESKKSICFVFWDQGHGIPFTMRRRYRDAFHHDLDMIERALETGYSRHRTNKRRGHGLSELLHLLELSPAGEFTIHSGRGSLTRVKNGEAQRLPPGPDIHGTLLEWTVRREPT